MTKHSLAINVCQDHGVWAISIDDESGGIRLTDGKCCGRWEVVKSWPLTHRLAEAIIVETQCARNADERQDE